MNKGGIKRCRLFLFFCAESCTVSAKQHGNAPKAGKTYKGVNDAAEESILTAKEPRNQIKLEDAYKAPV